MGKHKRISLRGTFADEVAQKVKSAPDSTTVTTILAKCLIEKSYELLQIDQHDTILIGKKSELGEFPPDW